MSLQKKIKARKLRRALRTRHKQFKQRGILPRISVFRSARHIYAQIIDDAQHHTIASFSSLNLKGANGDKKAIARQVGLELGKLAREKSVENAYFDRGAFLYTGRVRALADGLREAGLKF